MKNLALELLSIGCFGSWDVKWLSLLEAVLEKSHQMFALFLHSSTDATDLAAVRKMIVGWMDLSLSRCGCSSATVNGVVQGWPLAREVLLLPSPCQGIPVLWGMGWNCSPGVWCCDQQSRPFRRLHFTTLLKGKGKKKKNNKKAPKNPIKNAARQNKVILNIMTWKMLSDISEMSLLCRIGSKASYMLSYFRFVLWLQVPCIFI